MAGRHPKITDFDQSIQIQDLDELRAQLQNSVFSTRLQDVITAFLDSRRILGRKNSTIHNYRVELIQFTEYLTPLGVEEIDQLTPLLVKTYLHKLWNTRNHGGVHASYRVLRAFFNWYKSFEDPDWFNPADKIKVSTPITNPLPGIPIADVFALVQVSQVTRDKAIFLTLVDSGLRAHEMLNLNIENIDLMYGSIHAIKTKGDRPRITFVSDEPRRLIRKYLKERGAQSRTEPLFTTDDNAKRLSYNGLVNLLRRRTADAKLDYQPMPHDFRRTFALEMHRNGCDPTIRKILLGHRDSSVTARYLDFSERDLLEAHRKASPVANYRKTST
jgi:site-specific recombinase XerD